MPPEEQRSEEETSCIPYQMLATDSIGCAITGAQCFLPFQDSLRPKESQEIEKAEKIKEGMKNEEQERKKL